MDGETVRLRRQGIKLEPLDLELPHRGKLFISCWRDAIKAELFPTHEDA